MKVLVIYNSVFGNTEKIAQAIANALRPKVGVELFQAGTLTSAQLLGSDLLIVGSPTRGFRPTEAVAALLKGISGKTLSGIKVAAFDTRFEADQVKSVVTRGCHRNGRICGEADCRQPEESRRNSGGPTRGFLRRRYGRASQARGARARR